MGLHHILTEMDFPDAKAKFNAARLKTISWCNPDEFWLPHGWGEGTPLVKRVDHAYLLPDRIQRQLAYWEGEHWLNLTIARACTASGLPPPSTTIRMDEEDLAKELNAWSSRMLPVIQSLTPYAVIHLENDSVQFSSPMMSAVQEYKPAINPRIRDALDWTVSKIGSGIYAIMPPPVKHALENCFDGIMYG